MRRITGCILILALALSLSACGSFFEKEYFSSSAYEPPERESGYEGATEVSSYIELTIAVNNLVSEHGERGLLHFTNYSGDIAEDLAAACREVSTGTALGNYAVDYISYDLDRIVAYYEAEVYVYYKRSAEDLESMFSVNTDEAFYDVVRAALAGRETRLTVSIGASAIDEVGALDCVDAAYFSDPLACVERPGAEATVYTGGGLQRIVELELDYGATDSVLASRRGALENTIARLTGSATSESAAYRALQCAIALTDDCAHSEDAPGTLWSALMAGEADSEGMAVAYKALCDAAGIDCLVVEGRLDREEHYWNIITVDGESYHVDTSRTMELGYGATFLISDAQMWGGYWWDNSEYPECSGPLSYAAITESARPVESAPPAESPPPEESAPPQE